MGVEDSVNYHRFLHGEIMKQKIYVSYPIDDCAVEKIRKNVPDVFATQNGEEVLALVRDGEVERVCIAFGAVGFSEFEIMEAIHKIDPTIPVLVLSSEIPKDIHGNEYITTNVGFFIESINAFLNGELAEEDYTFFSIKSKT